MGNQDGASIMGDRYYVDIECPKCGTWVKNWYYAPTSYLGTHWNCGCGEVISLEEYTGITYADASNLGEMEAIIEEERLKHG